VESQKGSHVQLSSGKLKVTVPNHQTLAPKTLKSILRQASLTVDQFKAEL